MPHAAPQTAKELADNRLGRFIFVFTPSEKLSTILSGKLSCATVVAVGELTRPQALDFLDQLGCDASRAAAVYGLLDGHLPFLVLQPVSDFCLGTLEIDSLAAHFTALVRSRFELADLALECEGAGCACSAACAVRDKKWGHLGLKHAVPLLLKEHIVRASLTEKINKIDSRFILCSYLPRACACNSTASAVVPPCGSTSQASPRQSHGTP